MLPQTLVTNEVKDSAGIEQEFGRLYDSERKVVFAKVGEAPNLHQRITVQHSESGAGIDRVRRSNQTTDYEVTGVSGTKRTIKVSTTVTSPDGDLTSFAPVTTAMAYHQSFLASRGATTTILYDGTGCGAEALINGSL